MSRLNNLIEKYGYNKINSVTKYPSILTYHELGNKGMLQENLTDNRCFNDFNEVYVTEKIDGTNSRIIVCDNDYIIGSRENLLYAKGDRIGDPSLGIVDTTKSIADRFLDTQNIFVLYGETYGGVVTSSSKQYTNSKTVGFRAFDVAVFTFDDIENILSTKTIEQIASYRDHEGQHFLDVGNLKKFCEYWDIQSVPYVKIMNGNSMPTSRQDTFDWLENFVTTSAGLDHIGKAEGVVVRSFNRNLIRKIRFEDYERTKKRGGF